MTTETTTEATREATTVTTVGTTTEFMSTIPGFQNLSHPFHAYVMYVKKNFGKQVF